MKNKRATHTTPFSQMTLMRSWTPGSPWGILVKSSFPMARCLMVKGRWSDATTFRVSLRRQSKERRKRRVRTCIALQRQGEAGGSSSSSPSQQAHQVVGSPGVQAERRHGDVGGGLGPVWVVVLHAVQHGVSGGGFTVDHLSWRQEYQYL